MGSSSERLEMIFYHPFVVSIDIPALDSAIKKRIMAAIKQKLSNNPSIFGLPLRGTLKGLWKFRVGDWRVIYIIEKMSIKIIMIAHRKEVYHSVTNRI